MIWVWLAILVVLTIASWYVAAYYMMKSSHYKDMYIMSTRQDLDDIITLANAGISCGAEHLIAGSPGCHNW